MPKFSILIIEDEKNIQTFMRKILIRHGYRYGRVKSHPFSMS